MFKQLLIIAIGFCVCQKISSECPKSSLYCFDGNNTLLGNIDVNQCWKWSLLRCVPCSTDIGRRDLTFKAYIHHCRYFYPKTESILQTRNPWAHKIKNMLYTMSMGK